MYEKVDFTEFFQKLVKEFPFCKMSLRCSAYCIAISRNFLDSMEKHEILSRRNLFSVKSVLKSNYFSNALLSRNFVKNMRANFRNFYSVDSIFLHQNQIG